MTKDNSHATLAKLTETHSPIMSLRLGAQLVIGSKIHNLGLGFSDKCDESWKNFQTIYRSEIFSAKALDSQPALSLLFQPRAERSWRTLIRRFGVVGTAQHLSDMFLFFYGWDFQSMCKKLVDVVEKIFDSWGDIVGERRKKRVNGKDSADALIQSGFTDQPNATGFGLPYIMLQAASRQPSSIKGVRFNGRNASRQSSGAPLCPRIS
ncbi:hypothetical protein LguiA_034571 [Lonicera macranthoides]